MFLMLIDLFSISYLSVALLPLFILFLMIYANDFGKQVKKQSKHTSEGFKMGLSIFLMISGHIFTIDYVFYYFGIPIRLIGIIMQIIGIGLIILGISIYFYCFWLFLNIGKGTPFPANPPRELVRNGPYEFSRNPMYLALLIILVGEFLLFGHFLLLIYTFFIAILFHLYITSVEEPDLTKKFGS